MRTRGAWVSTLGRCPDVALNLSHTASLIRRVTNSMLLSGQRTADTLTRIVSPAENQSFHGRA